MFPVILKIGSIAIYSHGVFLVLALLFGLFWAWKKGKEEHLDEEKVFTLVFKTAFFALLGSRLAWVVFNWERFGFNFYKWLAIAKFPGLNFWGGLVFGLGVVFYWAKKQGWQVFKILDVLAIAGAFAIGIGRVGDFLGGNMLGKTTNWIWGVRFPGEMSARHPVALLEFVWFLALGYGLVKLENEYRHFEWYKKKRGQTEPGLVFSTGLLGLGLIKFVNGFFLANEVLKISIFNLDNIFGLILVIWSLWQAFLLSGITEFSFEKISFQKRKKSKKRVKKGADLNGKN